VAGREHSDTALRGSVDQKWDVLVERICSVDIISETIRRRKLESTTREIHWSSLLSKTSMEGLAVIHGIMSNTIAVHSVRPVGEILKDRILSFKANGKKRRLPRVIDVGNDIANLDLGAFLRRGHIGLSAIQFCLSAGNTGMRRGRVSRGSESCAEDIRTDSFEGEFKGKT